ncbi:MAG: DUF3368 domain-containing protein [Acidobacteria bacterium]|nr:DUF3368 domain-containing protein [Acidobacteriota bacterium]
MIVVSDSTPLHYLVLIGEVGILHQLFGRVIIPGAVFEELQHEKTPEPVKGWMAKAPGWVQVMTAKVPADPGLAALGAGEREAIALAQELRAHLVLMDDKAGRLEAARRNLKVAGLVAVLEEGAKRGLLNLPETLGRLQQTSFRISQEVLDSLIERGRD